MSQLRTRSVIGALTMGLVWLATVAQAKAVGVGGSAPPDGATRPGAATAACAQSDSVATSVSDLLGRDMFVAAQAAGVRFAVTDSGGPQPAAVEVTFADRTGRPMGRRLFRFTDSSCRTALEAAAVAVALFLQDRESAVDDTVATEQAAPPASPAPVPPTSIALQPVRAPDVPVTVDASVHERVRASAARPPWAAGLRAGAVAGGGDVPWGFWGLEATVRVRRRGWPEFFAGAGFRPQQWFAASGVDLSWARTSGRVGLCPFQLRGETRRVAGCAALDVGRLTVRSTGLSPSYRQDQWTAGTEAAVAVTQRLYGGWSLMAEARLVVPFLRSRVDVADGSGVRRDLFRASVVGAAGALSLGYFFGGPGD